MLVFYASIALLAAGPAHTEQSENAVPIQVQVNYTDLDLASDAGVNKLRQRLRYAVAHACPMDAYPSLAARAHASACRKRAGEQTAQALERAVFAARGNAAARLAQR